MPALREIFAQFGIEFDKKKTLQKGEKATAKATKQLKGLDKASKKVAKSQKKMGAAVKKSAVSIGQLGAAIGAAAIAHGIRSIVESTVDSTIEISRWSERLGLSEQALFSWSQVAGRFGADLDDMTDGFKELQLKTRDAMTGGGLAGDAWALLGIQIEEVEPIINDQEALMERFIDGINGVDAATRRFVVDEMMSDAGTRLTGMFEEGTATLRGYREEINRTSGRDIPALTRETRLYLRQTNQLTQVWIGLRNAIVTQILPALTAGVAKLRAWFNIARDLVQNTNILKGAFVALGVAATAAGVAASVAWGPTILIVGGVILAVAALALVVGDFITFINEDGPSVTGEFLEWALGAQGAATAVVVLKQAFEDLKVAASWFFDILDVVGAAGNIPGALGLQIADIPGMLFDEDEPEAPRQAPSMSYAEADRRTSVTTERGRIAREERRSESVPMLDDWADPDYAEQSVMAETAHTQPTTRPRIRRRRHAAPTTVPAAQGSQTSVQVAAPMTVDVTINEATDGAEVDQRVRRAVQRASSEQARELVSALTSDAELAGQGG